MLSSGFHVHEFAFTDKSLIKVGFHFRSRSWHKRNDIHPGSLTPLARLIIGILTRNPRPLFRLSPSLSRITEAAPASGSARPTGGTGAWLCNSLSLRLLTNPLWLVGISMTLVLRAVPTD